MGMGFRIIISHGAEEGEREGRRRLGSLLPLHHFFPLRKWLPAPPPPPMLSRLCIYLANPFRAPRRVGNGEARTEVAESDAKKTII